LKKREGHRGFSAISREEDKGKVPRSEGKDELASSRAADDQLLVLGAHIFLYNKERDREKRLASLGGLNKRKQILR